MQKFVMLVVCLLKLCCAENFAQVKGSITDKATGAPVAYANIQVENGTTGTTAAEDGTFSLDVASSDNVFLIVSSVGYERQRVRVEGSNLKITLAPTAVTLAGVTVRKPGKVKKREIGSFKKSDVRSGFGIGSQHVSPWIIARYFPYNPAYSQTPFIHEITLVTRSNIRNAVFRLRLLRATPDGTPGNDLLQKPLLVQAPKGNRLVTVALEEHQVQVPPEGFFIAFEWLLIPQNKRHYSYITADGTKKAASDYEPTLAAALVNTNHFTWIYSGGTWTRNSSRHSDGSYSEPQYKVVLSE